jgi:hypothetical protein
MIGELRAVIMRVAVESRLPASRSRKTDNISIAALVRHIDHHNDAVGWALFVPAMESDDLGPVVKMIEMKILPA